MTKVMKLRKNNPNSDTDFDKLIGRFDDLEEIERDLSLYEQINVKPNPKIIADGKAVFADGTWLKAFPPKLLEENILRIGPFPTEGIISFEPETYYIYLTDSPESTQRLREAASGKSGGLFPMFPLRQIVESLPQLWKLPQSQGVIGIIWYVVRGDHIYIEMMATRPGFKRNRVTLKMLEIIKSKHNIEAIDFGSTTRQGEMVAKKFVKEKGIRVVKNPSKKKKSKKSEISFSALIVQKSKKKNNPEKSEEKAGASSDEDKILEKAPSFEKRFMKLARLFDLASVGPVINDDRDILDRANGTDHKPYLEALLKEAKTPAIRNFIRFKLDMLYGLMEAPQIKYEGSSKKISLVSNPRVRSVKQLQNRLIDNLVTLYSNLQDSQYGSAIYNQSVKLIMWAQGVFFAPDKNSLMTAIMFDRIFDKKSDVPDMKYQIKRIMQEVHDDVKPSEEIINKFVPGSFALKALAMFNRGNMQKAEYYKFATDREAIFINDFFNMKKTVALIDLINFIRIYCADNQTLEAEPLIKELQNKISNSAFKQRFDGEDDEVWTFRIKLGDKVKERLDDFYLDANVLIRKSGLFIGNLFITKQDLLIEKTAREHRKLEKLMAIQRANMNKSYDDQDEFDYKKDKELLEEDEEEIEDEEEVDEEVDEDSEEEIVEEEEETEIEDEENEGDKPNG